MITVLFPGSQELWRIRGRERRNLASQPFRQSGAFREEARKYWVFLPLDLGERDLPEGRMAEEKVLADNSLSLQVIDFVEL